MRRIPGSGSPPLPGPSDSAEMWSRSSMFGLLSGMYLCPPTREALEAWRSLLEEEAPAPLRGLRASILAVCGSAEPPLDDLLWEYTRLFLGPYRLPAPPWESVYTSPKRLLMQEAYDSVLEMYREAGLSIPDPKVHADHIGCELNFLAVLYEREESGKENAGRAAELAGRFLAEHLRIWVPAFSRDLEAAAKMDLYRELARATRDAVGSTK